MNYPDCYDPIFQAEQREARWDRWLREHPEGEDDEGEGVDDV